MKPSEKALIKAKRAEKRSRETLPDCPVFILNKNQIRRLHGRLHFIAYRFMANARIDIHLGFSPILRILRWATIAIAVVASFFLVHVIIHPEWAIKKEGRKT